MHPLVSTVSGLKHALTIGDVDRCAEELHTVLASNLTEQHMFLLRAVIGVLAQVAEKAESNQMTRELPMLRFD